MITNVSEEQLSVMREVFPLLTEEVLRRRREKTIARAPEGIPQFVLESKLLNVALFVICIEARLERLISD